MRELIYYVASSLDGYIAHEDGTFEGFPWDEAYGADLLATYPETFPVHARGPATRAENKLFDAVLMGRKTYEVGQLDGITSPYPTLDQYVFSRTMEQSPDEHVTLIRGDAGKAVQELKEEQGKAIWLCGGADLAATLFEAGLVDRMIVKLNPVLFGSGIPLYSGRISQTLLDLTESKVYDSGHVVLHYRVKR